MEMLIAIDATDARDALSTITYLLATEATEGLGVRQVSGLRAVRDALQARLGPTPPATCTLCGKRPVEGPTEEWCTECIEDSMIAHGTWPSSEPLPERYNGTSGQDRESYTDDQDRESYTTENGK